MATPNVAGSLILLQQHYENLNGPASYLRAASLKALTIHTADEAGADPGPDYAFGWGLLNTRTAAGVISGVGGNHQIIEGSLVNGGVNSVEVSVGQANAVLAATLVWADPPGTPPAPSLDPPDLMLVNDLDLRIVHGTESWLPWVLDPENPSAAATRGDNFRDNVEQVQITPAATCDYTVEVRHKGNLLDDIPQNYSLIISVTPPPPESAGFEIEEDFSGGLPAGWSVETVEGIPWTINAPIQGDPRLDNNTGGSGNFAMVNNNYVNQTETSLRTPVLDLSEYFAAVLRFSSAYVYDTIESLNVDVSTDGGTNWVNAWTFQGFNPLPTRYVLDLSSTIAGEANVMLRFRYDSEGELSGDYWKVDDVELEVFGGPTSGSAPGPVSGPGPADGATAVALDTDLAWTAGNGALSHDVYFGTASSPGVGEFRGNQAGPAFDPGPLAPATTYFWRIDEVNADGTTPGCTWSFTTADEPPETIHADGFEGG
jgi:hypothetical protein